jgi:hypothetical protein
MDQTLVKEGAELCKQLFKSKLKQSPDIAEESRRRCRVRLMTASIFCAQRNLSAAFHMSRENFQRCIADPNKRQLRVIVHHPLGKLRLNFNKKNSDKIKGWLTSTAQPTV